MEEDSHDVHSPEKNQKRRLKTPLQVEALENFYNEHKYPSETMKSQLAVEIGLSEKQISGWFCHRRLKDKKLLVSEAWANGKQDLSNGFVPDRSSGLRQDSCSSAKQEEYGHYDPREVESRRSYDQDYPAAVLNFENRGPFMRTRHYSAVDDTSSRGSSALQDRPLLQSEDPYNMKPLEHASLDANYTLKHTRGSKGIGYTMSPGYLYSQNEIENRAISTVKRKLGRYYCEDGPPLGINFQPLPPDAFDLPIRDSIQEPYYVEDPIQQYSHSIPRVSKELNGGMYYSRYGCKVHPHNSYREERIFGRTMWGSDHEGEFTRYPSAQKSSFTSSCNHNCSQKSVMDMDEDSCGETSGLNSNNYGMQTQSGHERRSDFSKEHHLRLSGGKVFSKELTYSRPLQRREYLEAEPTNLVLQRSDFNDSEDELLSKSMRKEEKLYKERRMKSEHGDPIPVKMILKNETKMGKRMNGGESQARNHVFKMPSPQELPFTKPIKGYAREIPTSLSEDETAGISSSSGS